MSLTARTIGLAALAIMAGTPALAQQPLKPMPISPQADGRGEHVLPGPALDLGPSATEIRESVRFCAKAADKGERLACFEQLATALGVGAAAEGGPAKAASASSFAGRVNWSTDRKQGSVVIATAATDGAAGDNVLDKTKAVFYVRCANGQAAAYINFGRKIAIPPKPVRVTHRIDGGVGVAEAWTPSASGESLGLWSSVDVGNLMQRLGPASRFVVTATMPDRQTAITVEFEVGGLDEALGPIREACAW